MTWKFSLLGSTAGPSRSDPDSCVRVVGTGRTFPPWTSSGPAVSSGKDSTPGIELTPHPRKLGESPVAIKLSLEDPKPLVHAHSGSPGSEHQGHLGSKADGHGYHPWRPPAVALAYLPKPGDQRPP